MGELKAASSAARAASYSPTGMDTKAAITCDEEEGMKHGACGTVSR